MEHMKRMLVVVVALVLAGAGLMYVHRNMYKNCADNVLVQYKSTGQEDQDGILRQHGEYQPDVYA